MLLLVAGCWRIRSDESWRSCSNVLTTPLDCTCKCILCICILSTQTGIITNIVLLVRKTFHPCLIRLQSINQLMCLLILDCGFESHCTHRLHYNSHLPGNSGLTVCSLIFFLFVPHLFIPPWHHSIKFSSDISCLRVPLASNLEQVANLRCARVNSASYPSWDGKWVVTYELWGEGLVWLIGAVVYLCGVLHRGSNCSLAQAMDGHIMRHGIISSCQSAATSEIVKHFWSRVGLM